MCFLNFYTLVFWTPLLFTWGSFQMFSQIACLNRWKVALIAFERLFTWGSFQMFSQIACMNRCKVTNGCICTFFSTVSSNCLPEQMQSRIDCICMLFSRVSFQMCPQIACLYRCKVALVAFVCFFKCLLKLTFPTAAKSHWLHLNGFSREWILKCVFKWPARTDAKSHWLHLYDFSSEWVFECFLRLKVFKVSILLTNC